MRSILKEIKLSSVLLLLLGSAILAFGLYNIHSMSNVTEGGILGLTLLLEYWFGISPSVSGFVLTILCYFLGWKLLGKRFLIYSFISSIGFSVFYRIFEQFDPLFPNIGEKPLLAAVVGALFVGISVGLCVRVGGAPTGDDALAMSLERVLPLDIQWIYLISDLVVLLISLTYIPVSRITYSLLTVVLSGQIILAVQYYAEPKIVANVPPNCFMPRPKVGSAVIRLTRHQNPPVTTLDEKLMFRLIRASFNQRRKTLSNSLKNSQELPYSKEEVETAITECGLPLNIRGEALTLEQFARLSDAFSKLNK